MATRNHTQVTVDGERFRLSPKQVRALQEQHYSLGEAFADLGSRATAVLAALVGKQLFNATAKGVRRTALGGKVNKAIIAKNNGK